MPDRNYRIRFADNNFAPAGTVTVSSSATGYPASNLTDSYRFRQWRPKGNFTVSSSNKKIYINDGSDKTITLTEANYAGGAALAAHIQTQLNASSSAWTVTYSTTTWKFTFAHTGSATLRFSVTTDASWDMLGFTGAVDDTDTSWVADEQRNHTDEWITVDLGSARESTFFALLGPLGETFGISSGATRQLMLNTTSTFTAPSVTQTIDHDETGLMRWLDDLADTTYRYVRFRFVDRTNAAGPESFKFGHFYIGDHTTIERRNVASGFEKRMIDPVDVEESVNGALWFATATKYLVFDQVAIGYMDATDRLALEQTFYDLGRSTPFYVSFDPTLIASETVQELTRYVVFQDEPIFTHVKHEVYSVRMSFREVM